MIAIPRWSVAAALLLTVFLLCAAPSPVFADGAPFEWSPTVTIVWPHDSSGSPTTLAASTEVNVSVWPTLSVSCTENPGLSLWVAFNNDPAGPLSPDIVGHLVSRRLSGSVFPSLEFNDVPLNLAANPTARFAVMAGRQTGPLSNVWIHALDTRTYLPAPVVPAGYGTATADQLDSRIQIVFPHDSQGHQVPVAQANFVNIAVDVFVHGTLLSVPPDFQPESFVLEESVGNGLLRQLAPAVPPTKTTYTVSGHTYPRWVFNNVPVQPNAQSHFIARVVEDKIGSPYSNVWTHAAAARTILPNPSPPPACAP